MHSIRVKITAVTIAAILTSILALGGIGILTIGMESDQSSVEKMSLISENMQQRLDFYLNSLKQSVDMGIHMADDSLKGLDMSLLDGSLTPEEKEALDAILTGHCDEVEHAFTSIAKNTNGIVTYYYCINADLGSSENGFFWSALDGEEFVKQPDLISTDLDINDTEHTTWYYSPLKAGRPVWVGPYTAHYLGDRQTISYVAPIYCYGFLVGVLGMDILMDTMVDQVKDLKVYDTGFVFLMDQDGTILYHPDMEAGSILDLGVQDDPEVLGLSSSRDKLIRYNADGKERQLAFSTLANHMKVGVTVPVSEITASRRKLTLFILLLAVVILAIFAIFTLVMMGHVTKPLLRLAAASERLIAGDYDVELDYEGKDEVGVLTEAFRQMRDHLKLYISDLNSRAYTDAMTGVKNKGAFTISAMRLNDVVKRGRDEDGTGSAFAIVMFDCNDLKDINDRYGHAQGDTYLKNATRMICRVFAHSPVFRLGGDEFCAILQGVDYEEREELLESFDRLVVEHNRSADQPWEEISLSKGMAVYDHETDGSVEQVVARADEQMYADKRRRKQETPNGSSAEM